MIESREGRLGMSNHKHTVIEFLRNNLATEGDRSVTGLVMRAKSDLIIRGFLFS